jgi:hypothetical protein
MERKYIDRLIHIFVTIFHKGFKRFSKYKNTTLRDGEELLSIDVVIPLIHKDLAIAGICIKMLKKNCLNPINKIFIVSPESSKIRTFCNENCLIFINENDASPISKEKLASMIVSNRVGWILQQLIKLNSDQITDINRYFLLFDADTILNRKQFFITNQRYVLKHSDEFHYLYRVTNRKIIGYSKLHPPSYITHHQLIDKVILKQLKNQIQTNSKDTSWYDVIIRESIKNSCYFSEYELYAAFLLKKYRKRVIMQYWFNSNKKIQNLQDIDNIKISEKLLSASFHNYLKTP